MIDNLMNIQSFGQLIDAILVRKISFVVTFFVVFFFSYGILAWLDFLPEPVSDEVTEEITAPLGTVVAVAETSPGTVTETIAPENQTTTSVMGATSTTGDAQTNQPVGVTEFPELLAIDSLNTKVKVLNPSSRTIADLDNALLSGVVRHPDSALLGQTGTVFLLGHSSYLPTVINKNFQAFNGIQKLNFGDLIKVNSDSKQYTYRVVKVYKAKAQDVTVPIAGKVAKLVLATCNSFGSTDDRYIVEAELTKTDVL